MGFSYTSAYYVWSPLGTAMSITNSYNTDNYHLSFTVNG